ncbi:MAG: ImmA/IrrE family metallo-endopeptidase [Candidatus Diapherotrites archaeon]
MNTALVSFTRPFSVAKLAQLVQNGLNRLVSETDSFRQSALYQSYLDAMAAFWSYSFRNQMLIRLQCPISSRVAGFRAWNRLGRRILLGSKGIKILAPYSRKSVRLDALTGEESEIDFTAFFPVTVFDVSQTYGKELPRLDIDLQGNSHEWMVSRLSAFCESHHIHLETKNIGVNGLYGYSQGGTIVLSANQTPNMTVNTLVHEIAHELLHHFPEAKMFSNTEQEIQAEGTAYVVCQALGLRTKSPQYLASYSKETKQLIEQLNIISGTAKEILWFVQKTGK